jgi:glucose-6-phosphate 1-epimerase
MNTRNTDWESKLEIPGCVTFQDGQGDLPTVAVNTARSTAEIYLHGAHVTHFQKKGDPPLLFLSRVSRFAEEQPIRGGIPVILPWFGPRDGTTMHGFARLKAWDLKEIRPLPDGSVSLRFRLPDYPEASSFPPFAADYVVTVSDTLTLQLVVTNNSPDTEFAFENCLHTYFAVGDISAVSIVGLKGVSYLDKVAGFARRSEMNEAIQISSEVDRIYMDSVGLVEILDSKLGRTIRLEKEGSASTVVWNPWAAKAQQLPDFSDDEYQQMVCVESGNVGPNKITLPPGKSSTLSVELSTALLG